MNIGLLYFDDNPKHDLTRRVVDAAKRYKAKYNAVPEVCYVHPDTDTEGLNKIGRVEIRKRSHILRHHFWIGREQHEKDQ